MRILFIVMEMVEVEVVLSGRESGAMFVRKVSDRGAGPAILELTWRKATCAKFVTKLLNPKPL